MLGALLAAMCCMQHAVQPLIQHAADGDCIVPAVCGCCCNCSCGWRPWASWCAAMFTCWENESENIHMLCLLTIVGNGLRVHTFVPACWPVPLRWGCVWMWLTALDCPWWAPLLGCTHWPLCCQYVLCVCCDRRWAELAFSCHAGVCLLPRPGCAAGVYIQLLTYAAGLVVNMSVQCAGQAW